VRRDLVAVSRLLISATLALVLVAAFVPGRLTLAARIYALVVCGTALALTLRALRRAYPPVKPVRARARRQRPSRRAPASLSRFEHELVLATAGAFELHLRFRPHVRALAADLLETRRGISLDDRPDEARALLGAETWNLVRADRLPPEDRLSQGLGPAELELVVDSLERV
jgi:hypothetical protein